MTQLKKKNAMGKNKRPAKAAKKVSMKKAVEINYEIDNAGKRPSLVLQKLAEALKDSQNTLGEPLGDVVINYHDSCKEFITPKMLVEFTKRLESQGIKTGKITINYKNSKTKSSTPKSTARATKSVSRKRQTRGNSAAKKA